MKKKVFGAFVVVAIAMGAMINLNLNKVGTTTGDLAFANMEALAHGEGNIVNTCYDRTHYKDMSYIVTCYACEEVENRTDDTWCWSSTCRY